MLRAFALVLAAGAATAAPGDRITSLPGYGDVKQVMYSGMLPIGNGTYNKQLFYWFVEAAVGNTPGQTPVIIWMNGGPGCSSLTGILAEWIGPLVLTSNSSGIRLIDNPNTWSKEYNVLAIDSPVGAGFSYTKPGGWVKTQEEVRQDYYEALMGFLALHNQYRNNPFWVMGESYAGKYVPNVAIEIHNRRELHLKGVVIGNGMYHARVQYAPIPDYAFFQGIIDEHVYMLAQQRFAECFSLIDAGKNAEAMHFCEGTVSWLFESREAGAGQFIYDLGVANPHFFDDITAHLSSWLNQPDTKAALHVGNLTWVQADEKGPVAKALVDDFVTPQSVYLLAELLDAGFVVVNYNGVRDGSFANHVGNLAVLRELPWQGQLGFRAAGNKPIKLDGEVVGFLRQHEKLSFFTLLRTGHLVPIMVPKVALAMVDKIVGGGGSAASISFV